MHCTLSRSGRSRSIDAAVMLWTATHLDSVRPRKHRGNAAVVRNGSRYGRRSGSPRLRNSCSKGHAPVPLRLAAPGVSRENPPRPSGCSGARVRSGPRLTYRTVRTQHEQLLIPHRSARSSPGIVTFCHRRTISAIKQDLVSRDANYSSPPNSDEV